MGKGGAKKQAPRGGGRKGGASRGGKGGRGGFSGRGGMKRKNEGHNFAAKRARGAGTADVGERRVQPKKEMDEAWMVDDAEANEELLNEDEDYAEFMANASALNELADEPTGRRKRKQRQTPDAKKKKKGDDNEDEDDDDSDLDDLDDDEEEEDDDDEDEVKPMKGKGAGFQAEEDDDERRRKNAKQRIDLHSPMMTPASSLSAAATVYDQQKRLLHQREVIARLAQVIMEVAATSDMFMPLETLHSMIEDSDPVVRNLALLSQAAVWRDVLPDYQIRERGLDDETTPTGEKVHLSKAVIEKRQYESGIVSHYKAFLGRIEEMLANLKQQFAKVKEMSKSEVKVAEEEELSAVRALCLLIREKPYFNFRSNLLEMMVPHLLSPRHKVSMECIQCVEHVFSHDISGSVILELVRRIGRVLKSVEFRAPQQVLEPYLKLAIREDVVIHPFGSKEDRRKTATGEDKPEDVRLKRKLRKQRAQQHVSQKLREFAKAEKLLKKQFQESSAEYNQEEIKRNYTAILDSVFTTYFRILKRAPKSPLLPVALSGVARHCKQINVDFMSDIIRAIEDIMLRTPGLPMHIPFHCARTALLALQSTGYYTDVDMTDFFTAVYKALVDTVLYTSSACVSLHKAAVPVVLSSGATEINSHDILPIALEALDLLLVAPKQLPIDRVAAFVKRICSVPLLCLPAQAATGFLCVVSKLVRKYPRLQNMLGGEPGVGSMGTYMPYLDMPDHANPWSTALWELPFLQMSPVYQPYYQKLVAQFLASSSPEMLDAPNSSELALMLKRDALWDGVLPLSELTNPPSSASLALKKNKTVNKALSEQFTKELQEAADAVESAAQEETPFIGLFNDISNYRQQMKEALKKQQKKITTKNN